MKLDHIKGCGAIQKNDFRAFNKLSKTPAKPIMQPSNILLPANSVTNTQAQLTPRLKSNSYSAINPAALQSSLH